MITQKHVTIIVLLAITQPYVTSTILLVITQQYVTSTVLLVNTTLCNQHIMAGDYTLHDQHITACDYTALYKQHSTSVILQHYITSKLYNSANLCFKPNLCLWDSCSFGTVVQLQLWHGGTAAALARWYSCSFGTVVQLPLWHGGTAASLARWYSCSFGTVVQLQLWHGGTAAALARRYPATIIAVLAKYHHGCGWKYFTFRSSLIQNHYHMHCKTWTAK